MPMSISNLSELRRAQLSDYPNFGADLYQALRDIRTQTTTMEQQTNSNMNGIPAPPPPISALRVGAGSGIFHLSIDHPGDFYRDVQYHAEYATDSAFTNPFPISMHTAREWRGNLGQMNLHFRAAVSYGASPPGPWVYANGPFNGAATGEPALPAQSQGSGTGRPGQGLSGPGPTPFRSLSGRPPVREYLTSIPPSLSAGQVAPQPPSGTVTVAPVIPGEPINTSWQVAAQMISVPVYNAPVGALTNPSTNFNWPAGGSFGTSGFASFDMVGPVEIQVACSVAPTSVKVLPSASGIMPVISGSSLTFTVSTPGQYVVEINGDWLNSLQIFANDPVVVPTGSGVTSLPLGTTTLATHAITAGTALYVPDGAILYIVNSSGTGIPMNGANIELSGHGIIDFSGCHGVCISTGGGSSACTNVKIDGLVLRGATTHNISVSNSTNVTVNNMKVIDNAINADGCDVIGSSNVNVANNYFRVCDDQISVKTLPTGAGTIAGNVTASGNIFWNCLAHAMCIGWESQFNITNVTFTGNTVIHDHGRVVLMGVESDDPGTISNTIFSNNIVEECQWAVEVAIFVDSTFPGGGNGPGQVNTTMFTNNTFPTPLRPSTGSWSSAIPGFPFVLRGYGSSNVVTNTIFSNCTVNGAHLNISQVTQVQFTTGTVVTP